VASSSSRATLSGLVNPGGLQTSVHFEYGLDPSYTGSGPVVYVDSTPVAPIAPDFVAHPVTARISNLVPNALYHFRLVATNGLGTTPGPDQTFRTAKDPAPPPPVLGRTIDVDHVIGKVFVKLPSTSSGNAAHPAVASPAPVKGRGFIPLLEPRALPTGTQIDARRGSLRIRTASGLRRGKVQSGTFARGLFRVTQNRTGLSKGLTTLSLLEGAFPGGPTYAACRAHSAIDRLSAHSARLSSQIIQTLHASVHGRFRTRGRNSANTVRGTVWDTTDRCDGTLTVVHRGTVVVTDFTRHRTIAVHAGHRYLARALGRRHP